MAVTFWWVTNGSGICVAVIKGPYLQWAPWTILSNLTQSWVWQFRAHRCFDLLCPESHVSFADLSGEIESYHNNADW